MKIELDVEVGKSLLEYIRGLEERLDYEFGSVLSGEELDKQNLLEEEYYILKQAVESVE